MKSISFFHFLVHLASFSPDRSSACWKGLYEHKFLHMCTMTFKRIFEISPMWSRSSNPSHWPALQEWKYDFGNIICVAEKNDSFIIIIFLVKFLLSSDLLPLYLSMAAILWLFGSTHCCIQFKILQVKMQSLQTVACVASVISSFWLLSPRVNLVNLGLSVAGSFISHDETSVRLATLKPVSPILEEAKVIHLFIRPFIHSFIHAFIHSLIHSSNNSFNCLFIHPFVHLSIHPSI